MFKPNVTVACIIRHENRYLLVEEHKNGRLVLNQPAGHLERNESLIEATTREVWEETGLTLTPQGLVGTYLFTSPHNGVTYLRFCFYYDYQDTPAPAQPRDIDIHACHWLTRADLEASPSRLRSPLVLTSLSDYERGQRADLALVKNLPGEAV